MVFEVSHWEKDSDFIFGRCATFQRCWNLQLMVSNCFHLQGFQMLFRCYLAAISQEIPQNEQHNLDDLWTFKFKMASPGRLLGSALYCELPKLTERQLCLEFKFCSKILCWSDFTAVTVVWHFTHRFSSEKREWICSVQTWQTSWSDSKNLNSAAK